MTEDLILLLFIAFLVAFGLNRIGRRVGLRGTGYAGAMVVFVLVALMLWASSQR